MTASMAKPNSENAFDERTWLGLLVKLRFLIVTFLLPVSAILLGIVLLNEIVDARQIAGMAAIFIGVAAIDGRAARFIARTLRR